MTTSELAVAAEVSPSMITKIENGVRPVTHPETVELIADNLRIHSDVIYRMQEIAPPDIEEMLYTCIGISPKRLRWALKKMIDGEMFDEELKEASISHDEFPKDVLVPRKRTVKEERAWDRIQGKTQVVG